MPLIWTFMTFGTSQEPFFLLNQYCLGLNSNRIYLFVLKWIKVMLDKTIWPNSLVGLKCFGFCSARSAFSLLPLSTLESLLDSLLVLCSFQHVQLLTDSPTHHWQEDICQRRPVCCHGYRIVQANERTFSPSTRLEGE